jgi:hypothetical protein
VQKARILVGSRQLLQTALVQLFQPPRHLGQILIQLSEAADRDDQEPSGLEVAIGGTTFRLTILTTIPAISPTTPCGSTEPNSR